MYYSILESREVQIKNKMAKKYINNKGLHKEFVQSMKGISLSDEDVTILSDKPKESFLDKWRKKRALKINITRKAVKSQKVGGVTFLYD